MLLSATTLTIVGDGLLLLILAELLQLCFPSHSAVQELLGQALMDLPADIVFDPEMGDGFVDESGDAVGDGFEVGFGNLRPPLRLLIEKLCEEDVVVVSRELLSACLRICLQGLSVVATLH